MMRADGQSGNRRSHNRSHDVAKAEAPSKARVRPRPVRPGSKKERRLWEDGYQLVAGVDEVGRGAWAGPLSVGVAVLCEPLARMPQGLRDSKQIAEMDREQLFDKVAAWSRAWAVGHSEPEECDRLGMTAALVLATRRAFSQLPEELLPGAVVLDGNFDFVSRAFEEKKDPPWPDGFEPAVHTVVKADARCVSVAAASVLAKVTRDRLMRAIAQSYPAFEFERNKGYPSPVHKRALRGYGLSAIHRRSWVFVENLPWADPYWTPRSAAIAEEERGTEACGALDLSSPSGGEGQEPYEHQVVEGSAHGSSRVTVSSKVDV